MTIESPTVRTETHRVVDVSTGGNRTLRIALAEDGEAGTTLIVSHGFGIGDGFHRPGYCGPPLRLPASVVGDLRAALEALEKDR